MIPIRIVMADDHEIFRNGFAALFQESRDMELMDLASNGAQLVAAVEKLRPDVVFTDIQMPVMNGTEATRIIHRRFPEIPVIAMSTFDDNQSILEMLRAGAIGYLGKYSTKDVVMEAARAAFRGETYYCRNTSQTISTLISSGRLDINTLETPDLSATDLRIIRMICDGMESAEIAEELKVSLSTVNRYRIEIAEKTGTKNLPSLVVYAVRNGIYKVNN